MTFQQALAVAVLAGTMALFVWGRWRYDLVAVTGLLAAVLVGVVPAERAFAGFSNDIVIIVGSALVVSAAVARSGVVERAVQAISPHVTGFRSQLVVLIVAVALMSAFVKNIGALAIMMPIAFQMARKSGTSISCYLMPMAFASLLGGLMTLVGTSPNVIVAGIREDLTGEPFAMFDYMPVGLALTAAGVDRILADEKAAERLCVAMNQRFRPDAVALRSFVQSGELGDVFYLKTGWLNRMQRRGRSWRESKEAAGGGAFIDLGLQMLDLALWILGYPRALRVSAQMHRSQESEVEDAAALLLRLEGDKVVNLEVSWNLLATRDRQFLKVLATAGSGSLSPLAVFREMPGGLTEVTPQLPPGRENLFTASYRNELQNFVEVVRGERPAEAPREQAALLRIVEAVYRSAEERREVEL